MRDAYIRGFTKVANAAGVDPEMLAWFAVSSRYGMDKSAGFLQNAKKLPIIGKLIAAVRPLTTVARGESSKYLREHPEELDKAISQLQDILGGRNLRRARKLESKAHALYRKRIGEAEKAGVTFQPEKAGPYTIGHTPVSSGTRESDLAIERMSSADWRADKAERLAEKADVLTRVLDGLGNIF